MNDYMLYIYSILLILIIVLNIINYLKKYLKIIFILNNSFLKKSGKLLFEFNLNSLSKEIILLNKKRKEKQVVFYFLSNFRAMLQLTTCIVILAVDFKFFPRKFCKVEEFGVSLVFFYFI